MALADSDRKRVMRDIARQRPFMPVTIRDDLNWEDVARVEVNALDLPGVAIQEGQSRVYPYGDALAHVMGYVAAVSETETDGDPLLQLPGFRVGKAGIEKSYEVLLRGTAGSSQLEVNAAGRVVRELDRKDGEPGGDLTLALDLDLQQLTAQRLGAESGAAVVVDVDSARSWRWRRPRRSIPAPSTAASRRKSGRN